MKTLAEIKTPGASYSINQAAGSNGARKYGSFVMLRILRVPNGALLRSVRSKGVEVMAEYEVDSRHTGPRSRYGKTLKALIARLPKAVRAADTEGCFS